MKERSELFKKLKADLTAIETSTLSAESQERIEQMKMNLDKAMEDESNASAIERDLRFLAAEFEASHPRLTEFINHVSSALSNAGL